MAQLVFSDHTGPGIGRVRHADGFTYVQPDGRPLKDKRALARIADLGIPPAWEQVWICPDALGHIQAVGRDARGRLQYRYHAAFRLERDAAKYSHIVKFARLLPRIRERIAADMTRPGLGREKVAATVAHLLESTMIRIGNQAYARDNKTFGLSTLRTRHLTLEGARLRFRFKGKSGKPWNVEMTDRRVARIVRACQELPGQQLFQYVDEDGDIQRITSQDVNAYLRDAGGAKVSAKDFRTWAATVLCAMQLGQLPSETSQRGIRRQVSAAIKAVSTTLGNTPAICRACYVHPEIITAHLDGDLARRLAAQLAKADQNSSLKPEEHAVLALLRERVRSQASARRKLASGGGGAAPPRRPRQGALPALSAGTS